MSMISIIVPSYNGLFLLQRNLPRLVELLQKTKLKYDLIIVDDDSSDREVKEYLEKFKKENDSVNVVYKDKNEGFASTTHRGFVEAKGEFVFVIKNDAVPENEKYFSILLKHFDDSKVFAVSAALKTLEKGKSEIRGCGYLYFDKGFFLHKRGSINSKITAWADGGASAFRKDLYFKIGGFDPLFNPAYWEDVDLGYRAWKAGYRVEFEPNALLLHDYEQSTLKRKYGEEKIRKISLRNQFIFTWKNADFKHLISSFIYEPYNHMAAMKRGEFDFVRIYWWAFLRWPKIILQRIRQKSLVKYSDDEVLNKISS